MVEKQVDTSCLRIMYRRAEMGGDALVFLRDRQCAEPILDVRPFFFDLARKALNTEFAHENLDAGLVLVVAAAVAVVHAQDRLDVGKHVLPRQVFAQQRIEDWRAPESTAGENAQHQLTIGVTVHIDADIVHTHGSPVLRG